MSVLIFFGMVGIIILIGIATIVSTLLQWKREPRPAANTPLAKDLNAKPEANSSLLN